MNEAAFPSPTAEMAEMNRIHYELEYTEGISQRMRIPEQLKVAPYNPEEQDISEHEMLHTAMMHVPERIVVADDFQWNTKEDFFRDRNDVQFPRDLDLIQSTPMESTLSLKTPPRVLTLSETPIDFLEMEHQSSTSQPSEEVRMQTRTRRERSVSENTSVHHNGQLARNDSMHALAPLDSTTEGGADDMALVDATSLRRQIVKLNRRLQLLEEENKERVKREMIMYSITVAFWLINSWVWFRR
ncbi:mitochondrial fission factor homolog B-like isoform X7 [Carassius carassius]|uniref:mitochondrial fission factor homolog B-like isoform X7 n=1 Tax=Carassius carassius TaxID=217509 RepID=UPI002868B1F0|nr:mitochondrial fission factor homolog B-like isoform X7 [Carassius carassius]